MAAALRLQAPGTAWVVATGALTNVGALFRAHPDLVPHVRGLSLMGGSFGGGFSDAPMGRVDNAERIGNVTPWAEFNILVDPEAAADVFHNPAIARKTTVVPLDLSHQVLATDDVHRLLLYGDKAAAASASTSASASAASTEPSAPTAPAPGKSTLRTMLVELLYFFAKTYSDVFGITQGPPLHDPIAVAAVLTGTDDEIPFSEWDEARSAPPQHAERFDVRVVTEGTFEEAKLGLKQTGRTIATPLPPGSEGVRIPRAMDVAKFWKVIEECIQRADTVNEGLQQ
ncbi:Uridine nucleosidase [Purpureocillium takamizusanense]|nr:Uridine nucleosidase [Purpureocillium takamizusanense]UNI21063.1 Uridine nucleosidase [Purpureocillium takamizusanense]